MITEMTAEQAANMLRKMAETTAGASQNWENYELICVGMLNDALAAGRRLGLAEQQKDTTP